MMNQAVVVKASWGPGPLKSLGLTRTDPANGKVMVR